MKNNIFEQLYSYLFSSIKGKINILLTSENTYDELKELFSKYFPFSLFLPSLDMYPYINSIPPVDKIKQRMSTIRKFLSDPKQIVLTTPISLFFRTISKEVVEADSLVISVGQEVNFKDLKNGLISFGYQVSNKVIEYGEVAFKGSVIDFFGPDYDLPVRIVLDFDKVESIRLFEPETQKSLKEVNTITICPPYENNFYNIFSKNNKLFSFYDIFNNIKVFSLIPFKEVEEEYLYFLYESEEIFSSLKNKDDIIAPADILTPLPTIEYLETKFSLLPSFTSDELKLPNYPILAKYITSLFQKKKVVFLSPNEKYTNRAISIFKKYKIPYNFLAKAYAFDEILKILSTINNIGSLQIIEGVNLPVGVELEETVIFTIKEFFNREFVEYEVEEIGLSSEEVKEIYFFENIKEGDYIVHSNYGIGIFRGIKEIKYFDSVKEFAAIEYEGGDILYVPPEQFNLLSKYIGSEEPKISSLKQKNWKSVKQKVKESILKFSRDMLRLKAVRQVEQRPPLKVDFEEYELFESVFPYEETPDQVRVIKEIKSDLISSKVMDRVICGDVGFGKTEIAIRTAYLHILNGNQVMVLVPTTILAEQHFKTFSERLKPFGVKVGIISRLRKEGEIKKTIEGISKGEIDLVIGTHALIMGEKVIDKFRRLGLIIIDEEHKFGVEHKESILKTREKVDVLTLSATPIPRTLGMGLSNLKDISLITTPPYGRKPIKTFIIEWNEEIIREAIKKEIKRNGQVLIINDKVKGIEKLKLEILKICNEIIKEEDICILHGQLNKSEIEDVFINFVSGKYKVMISTTISESGLDIPNVNTVIINNAHLFGLADLHQIRGRVGRRDLEGYAYFVYPSKYIISELQMKRLNTIEEHSDLGAGFRIALKDLELRGAGNLLGKEQHGNMKAVGYVFYVRMLSETLKMVNEIGDDNLIDYSDPVVYFSFDRVFPEDFEISNSDKMEIMLKLNVAFSERQVEYILSEINDRYGSIPEGVYNLAEIVKFRIKLKKFFIEEIYEKDNGILIRFNKNHLPDVEKLFELITNQKYEIEMLPNDSNVLILKLQTETLQEKLNRILSFLEEVFDLTSSNN